MAELEKLEFWVDRYKSLLKVLHDIHESGGIWAYNVGEKIPLSKISEAFPADFRAYLNVFGLDGQIGWGEWRC